LFTALITRSWRRKLINYFMGAAEEKLFSIFIQMLN
jgi:hypothetical protein